jgi:hypothetical protein
MTLLSSSHYTGLTEHQQRKSQGKKQELIKYFNYFSGFFSLLNQTLGGIPIRWIRDNVENEGMLSVWALTKQHFFGDSRLLWRFRTPLEIQDSFEDSRLFWRFKTLLETAVAWRWEMGVAVWTMFNKQSPRKMSRKRIPSNRIRKLS